MKHDNLVLPLGKRCKCDSKSSLVNKAVTGEVTVQIRECDECGSKFMVIVVKEK